MINKFKNKMGFTVLESIVAIAILSLSISGAFSSVQQSFSQSIIARDEVKAFYLAQEAIEIIRNMRDTNQLINIKVGGNSWLDNITTACPFTTAGTKNTCSVDATNFQITNVNCGGNGHDWGSCPVLKQDPSTFLYGYTAGNNTIFKREIQIERAQNDTLGNPIEIAVTVRISWNEGLIHEKFIAKTILFNRI
jgi:type II secretory pathway pseudopilin PulG